MKKSMNNPYLVRALTYGPMIVRRIVEAIPASQYDSHSDPDRFTVREAVAHLADWQEIDLDLLRLSAAGNGSLLEPYDESERAAEQGYVSTDVMEQLELFEARRRVILAFLDALLPEAWGNTGYHPEKGHMTVYDQANMLVAHDTYHIEHLSQYL